MYLHINPEDKVRECQWYARGFCKHGMKCRHKHIKKIMCENYFHGFCPLGPNCQFAHPKFDIPKEENTETKPQPMKPLQCEKCGQFGHMTSQCNENTEQPQFEKRPLETVQCYKCEQYGHYANKCPSSYSYMMQQLQEQQNTFQSFPTFNPGSMDSMMQ